MDKSNNLENKEFYNSYCKVGSSKYTDENPPNL